jgi:hypothetical protein
MNEQQLAAVKQAIEALMVFRYAPPAQRPLVIKAIADLEQALAAPVQEPVAVVSGYYGGQCVVLPINPARLFNSGTAFYTAPPAAQKPWVGLTDEEVMQTMSGDWTSQFYFARAIEAKLKEKNGFAEEKNT